MHIEGEFPLQQMFFLHHIVAPSVACIVGLEWLRVVSSTHNFLFAITVNNKLGYTKSKWN